MDFRIHACSDGSRNAHMYRDARVKDELARALVRRGHTIVYEDADLDIWLWGGFRQLPAKSRNNVLWVVSHPDSLTRQWESIAPAFRRILCASKPFAEKLCSIYQLHVEWAVCPAPSRPAMVFRPVNDLAFVGNANPQKGRPAMARLFMKYNSVVIGAGWKPHLSPTSFGGHRIAWSLMHTVWNSARIVPYTHHLDMAREGFVADSAIDVMVNSGALLISDHNCGWNHLGIDAPAWQTTDLTSLTKQVEYFLHREDKRSELAQQLQKVAKTFTYDYVAQRLEACA